MWAAQRAQPLTHQPLNQTRQVPTPKDQAAMHAVFITVTNTALGCTIEDNDLDSGSGMPPGAGTRVRRCIVVDAHSACAAP